MTKRSYRYILTLTVVTALVLTGAQVYFTAKNYEVNKQRFIQDVKQSLDAGIENYFAARAKSSIYILSETDTVFTSQKIDFNISDDVDSILKHIQDTTRQGKASAFTHMWSTTGDSVAKDLLGATSKGAFKLKLMGPKDSLRVTRFQNLTQQVMISISEDLLDIGELYKKVEEAMAAKGLSIKFGLRQQVNGQRTAIAMMNGEDHFTAEATSGYLGEGHHISIDFENATLIILWRGISELILSVLLVGLVIGTLIHLYRTINAQKQLAAIKDDLISNITHEFKTPIATIFSALEGVTSFNETNDPEKTKRYLALSNDQLSKLNNMVEKMLETATIDQGKLNMNEEGTEAVSWTKAIVDRFEMVEEKKSITFDSPADSIEAFFDRFHLENALSNLIDNAIKYGGDQIWVVVKRDGASVIWEVTDNGGNIPMAQREKIFDKLYRIPTGNQHDVKGFGIGLYYARNIAELHGGHLTLKVAEDKTVFKLKL